jgi:hypothetical protein
MPRASKRAAALDATLKAKNIRSKRLSACTTAARKELLAASFRAERRCRRTRLLPTQAPMTPLPHGFYRSFTMLGLSCESQRVTKMARTAPERSNFFVRSNYAVGVVTHDRRAVEKQPLTAATKAVFAVIEQAIRAIEEGAQAEAAMRQL